MLPTLLLRIPAPGQDETEWLILGDGGEAAPTRQRGSLSLAAAVWRTGHLIALAPSAQILLAEPELPPGGGAKLARAVPFALEEQLTEDVDLLSFAIGRRRDSGATPVAVVSRDVLQGWITELRAAGLEPQSIYPDISLMPENPGQTVLWLENDRLAVRRPGAMPFAVELSPVKDALVVAGVIADPLDPPLEPRPLESAILYISRDDWARNQAAFEQLADKFESLKVQLLADGPLAWLGRGIDSIDAINLMQGEYARATDYGARWKRWRLPAALAAGLLCVHVGAQALQIRQGKHEAAVLDGEIAQVFANVMPSDPLTNPRRQMQARLERARKSGSGPQYFMHALQSLSSGLGTAPKTTINSMSYREQTMDLTLSAPNLGSLSQLSQSMAKQGLAAEIQSSTPIAQGIEGHMQVRGQNAKGRK
jgi:general secretion pathway protein L